MRTTQTKKARKRFFTSLLTLTALMISVLCFPVSAEKMDEDYWEEPVAEEQQLEEGTYYIRSALSPYVFLNIAELEEEEEQEEVSDEGIVKKKKEMKDGQPCGEMCFNTPSDELLSFEVYTGGTGTVSFGVSGEQTLLGVQIDEEDTCLYSVYSEWRATGREIDTPLCQWLAEPAGDDTFIIRLAQEPSLVWTVEDEEDIQHSGIVLREEDGSDAQKIVFSSSVPKIEQELEEGDYCIRLGLSDYMVLSIGDGIYNDERDAYIYMSDYGDGQIWTIEYDEYGLAIIRHNNTSKVLTVRNNEAVDYQDIGQFEYDGGDWQKWLFTPAEDGGYYIRSALDINKAITLTDGELYNNSPVSLLPAHYGYDQFWFFTHDPVAPPPAGDSYMNSLAQGYYSGSGYLIMVDTSSNHVGVYTGSYGNWRNIYYWNCVTGKWSTPTPCGEYSVYSKQWSFDGNMDSPAWYTCYYCTQWADGYYFHSIIYYQGTWNVMDAAMGVNASHGCIRLYTDNALWIYNNIPYGTKVVIY